MANTESPFYKARTQYNQHGHQSLVDVEKATKIADSIISKAENNPDYGMSYQLVSVLAKHYGVTTDYLCGASPVHTTDPNIKMICDYTGLSQKAVEALHYATLPDEIEMDLPDVYVDKNGNVTKVNKNVPKTIIKAVPGMDAEALNRRTVSFINRVLEHVHAVDYEDGERRRIDTIFSIMEDYVCSSGARIEDRQTGNLLERVTVHYGANESDYYVRDLIASRMKESVWKIIDNLRDDHDAVSKKATAKGKTRKEKLKK